MWKDPCLPCRGEKKAQGWRALLEEGGEIGLCDGPGWPACDHRAGASPLLPCSLSRQTQAGRGLPRRPSTWLTLGPTLDGNAPGQSGLTGSLRSSSARLLLRQAPPPGPPVWLQPVPLPCPHDQPLHFLSSWCQLPREDQRVRQSDSVWQAPS